MIHALWKTLEQRPTEVAFREIVPVANSKECEVKSITWAGVVRDAKAVGRALLSDPCDKVIVSAKEGSIRWVECVLGVLLAGGVPTHLAPSSSLEQLRQCIAVCKTRWVLVDKPQAEVEQLQKQLEPVHVVSLDDHLSADHPASWQQFLAHQADRRLDKQSCPFARGKIVFVTWTDSQAQGLVFQDKSVLWLTEVLRDMLHITAKSRLLSFHSVYATAEQLVAFHLPVVVGCTTTFMRWSKVVGTARSEEEGSTLFDLFLSGMRCVKPSVLVTTPLVWTKMITVAQYQLSKHSGLLARAAMRDLLDTGHTRMLRSSTARTLRSKVEALLGITNKTELLCYGALPDHIRAFLNEIGMARVVELAGFPECGGVYGRIERKAPPQSGSPANGGSLAESNSTVVVPLNNQIRVVPSRNRHLSWVTSPGNFTGYFGNRELTRIVVNRKTRAVRDWRRLVMSITKMGLYVSSNVIQNALQRASPVINSVVVFAEGMRYVGVLLLINAGAAERELDLPVACMARSTELAEYLRDVIRRVNEQLPEDHRIVRFCHHVLTPNETKGNFHLDEQDLQAALTTLYGSQVKEERNLVLKPIDFNIWEPAGVLTSESVALIDNLGTESSSECGPAHPQATTTTTTTTAARR